MGNVNNSRVRGELVLGEIGIGQKIHPPAIGLEGTQKYCNYMLGIIHKGCHLVQVSLVKVLYLNEINLYK